MSRLQSMFAQDKKGDQKKGTPVLSHGHLGSGTPNTGQQLFNRASTLNMTTNQSTYQSGELPSVVAKVGQHISDSMNQKGMHNANLKDGAMRIPPFLSQSELVKDKGMAAQIQIPETVKESATAASHNPFPQIEQGNTVLQTQPPLLSYHSQLALLPAGNTSGPSTQFQRQLSKRLAPSAVLNAPPLAKRSQASPQGRPQQEFQGNAMKESVGFDFASQESRPHRRPSRWDITAPGATTQLIPDQTEQPIGITTYQQGAATWTRLPLSEDISRSGPHRRGRSASAAATMSHPYMYPLHRSPARAYSHSAIENDNWALRPISPTSSVGTQDSRMGGFSPPPAVNEAYSRPIQAQDIEGYGDKVNNNQQEGNEGKSMELDDGQRAPALEAPREP